MKKQKIVASSNGGSDYSPPSFSLTTSRSPSHSISPNLKTKPVDTNKKFWGKSVNVVENKPSDVPNMDKLLEKWAHERKPVDTNKRTSRAG